MEALRNSQEMFPPQVLRQYAVLADGERGAAIGPHGDIAWMCAPRWHSPAMFSSLIGGAGYYAICPKDSRYVWGGSYEDGSLIWRSRWVTTDSIIECREALAFPGDTDRLVLLRRVVASSGDARVRILLKPCADFGSAKSTIMRNRDCLWTGACGALNWRWTLSSNVDIKADCEDGALHGELIVPEGNAEDFVFEAAIQPLLRELPDAKKLWRNTATAWARSVPSVDESFAPRDARHAHAVLRGLTSSTGGMVAAATTSLPERADTGRNYDYRYVWIRDQTYAAIAAAAAGSYDLLDAATAFISERILADGDNMRPGYTVNGGPIPDEETLDLPGYPGGTARIGNHANQQFQLDAFGEALQLFAAAGQHDRLDAQGWRAAGTARSVIERRWDQPDAGIWELENRLWTHSQLACVAGLRSMAKLSGTCTKFTELADFLLAELTRTGLHPSGYWQRSQHDTKVDASLLLPGIRGALPADDPRTVRTLDEVRSQLSQEGYVYRFRHDDRDLGDSEGAFLLCGFVMSLSEAQQGHRVAAARWFERNRSACGPPGLFAEEFDIKQRQLRGNLPQAFSHALLLQAAVELPEAEGS